MADSPASVEKFGIEHIPEGARHGAPNRTFTLWFAANLTVADYIIGVLTTAAFGLTVAQAVPVLLLGNLLGGLFLGLSAAMGPKVGFPQMFSSRASFGRRGNYAPGAFNWVSTVGWFTVNTILGAEAVQAVAPSANFGLVASVLVALQVVIAVYGHDFIQLFERVMSVVLGSLFIFVFILTLPHLSAVFGLPAVANEETGLGVAASAGTLATVFAISFSYLMSWSPYASDYSRYMAPSTSARRVAAYALAGGAVASFAVELIGALVGSINAVPTIGGLYSFAGQFGWVAMLTVVLGAMAANALNIYTNALSALVLDVRARRATLVVAGGIVGLSLALLAGASFESFFENFLLALDYWITPWLAIVLVDYYVKRRTTVAAIERASSFDFPAIGIYALSILVSVPFMVPPSALPYPVGALASLFGGADFSYFISFVLAAVLTLLVRRRSLAAG
ncbi:MAG: cytosine permease [Nitrososphaerales archaeon]|nr:cytosine permease [Nitrososphaerales archaeon]